VEKERGKMIHFLIKPISEHEVSDSGREIIHVLIEFGSKREVRYARRKVRDITIKSFSELKMSDVRREVIDWMVEFVVKHEMGEG